VCALPDYHKIQLPQCEPTPVRHQLPHAPADAVDFIERLVVLVPTDRLSAAAALTHGWILGAGGPSAHSRAEPRMGRTHGVRSARRSVERTRVTPAGACLDVASKTSSYSPATPLSTLNAERECRIVEAMVDRFGSCEAKGGALARAWAARDEGGAAG